ncbi:hypothetical protein INS49_009158 [Diaporthe citri]|uniref:uncharacterized protein n=1 Tax=Diaporthe citri TaxID=83186 RepID=UPI001C7E532A|nr:uncharacterized protein INS49_009158 [Diaporthe citri]KAG6364055.1 hypothetical protein INS49_009158 [Diaporthe citri]
MAAATSASAQRPPPRTPVNVPLSQLLDPEIRSQSLPLSEGFSSMPAMRLEGFSDPSTICGYMSASKIHQFDSLSAAAYPFACLDIPCVNSGSWRGCSGQTDEGSTTQTWEVPTKCYDHGAAACNTVTNPHGQEICCDQLWPTCATFLYSTTSSETFTMLDCVASEWALSGPLTVEYKVRNHNGNGEYRPGNGHRLVNSDYLINSRDYEVRYHNDYGQCRDRQCHGSNVFSSRHADI